MFKKNKKKVPLQRYWITRYLWTLAIGLVVVAIASAWWIRHTALENRVNMMEFMAEEIANQAVRGHANEDESLSGKDVREFLTDPGKYISIDSTPSIYMTNIEGDILYQNNQGNQSSVQLNPSLLFQDKAVHQMNVEGTKDKMYMVKKPIIVNQTILGWVVLLEWKGHLLEVNQEYKQLFIMITALALFGSIAIYILSTRLAKPITEVAEAAEQVRDGNYEVILQDDVKEKELYELIHSFKEMSERLNHLETLRTELLAGVTHELKTPVTSISGLIQAVNDDVVEGDEAKEFLRISLQETAKMEKMVEDLLAFNAFATDTLPLSKTLESIPSMIRNFVHRWEITNDEHECHVKVITTSEDIFANIDSIRVEQIMINLLNNAQDARQNGIEISIHIMDSEKSISIDVSDNGTGIEVGEQPFIFERFYRGKVKQSQTSGFGLGLAFSKMIAQAHGGDLMLIESSQTGTVFQLTLPK